MSVRHRVIPDGHLRIRLGVGDHPLLGKLGHLARPRPRRRPLATLEPPEVPLGERPGFRRIEVADQGRRQVVGRVVGIEERQRLGAGDAVQIARPPDHRPAVGRRLPEHRVELLLELAGRRAVGPETAFLVNHVSLGVELAEHRVRQPVRFHPEPQLELVGRHIHEIDRVVVAGPRVHARGALPRVDAAEVLFDDQRVLLDQQPVETVEQLLMTRVTTGRVIRIVEPAQSVRLD